MFCLWFSPGFAAVDEFMPRRAIAEIRERDRSTLDGSELARIRGVVTLAQAREALVVQDETDAIYVRWSRAPGGLSVGDLVEVGGKVVAGQFAPVLEVKSVRKLGPAALPLPRVVEVAALRTGRYDCHYVQVRGVGRRILEPDAQTRMTRLELATATGPVVVLVEESGGLDPAALVDAELEVSGCCFAFFNPRGESTGVNVRVQNASGVRVLRPPPGDPFAAPEISPTSLRPFRPDGPILNRQRLTGTVTLASPGQFVYVQTAGSGFRVHTVQAGDFEPGDVVEVSGFVDPGAGFSVMNSAVLRRKGRGGLPEAVPITWAKVASYRPGLRGAGQIEDFDGSLVRLRGRLVKVENVPAQPQRLYLDHDGTMVVAAREDGEALGRVPVGAELELTGVCEVNLTSGWSPPYQPVVESLGLFVHSAGYIRLLKAPSWWTVGRLSLLLAVTGAALLAAIGAVLLFRRLARQRSRELAAEVLAREEQERARRESELEFRATLRERERLAADLHDTIEQSLTGVALQLDATRRAPERGLAERNLGLAAQMLARSREDVRRSVWNLRAQALDGQRLRGALRQIGGALLDGTPLRLEVAGDGEEMALPDFVAGNLLMLAKEAITNALKHASAGDLVLRVDYSPEAVALTVADNGVGFDVPSARGPHAGHFGLTGMRERAARLQGRFAIESAPGRGTRIAVCVPLVPAPVR